MKFNLNLIFILIFYLGYSQTVPLDYDANYQGNLALLYYKDLDDVLLKFEGTWVYQTRNELFELELYRMEYVDYDDFGHRDQLAGNFKYIKNGEVIMNTLNNMPSQGSDRPEHFHMAAYNVAEKKMIFSFKDPIVSKWTSFSSEIEILNPDVNGNMRWRMKTRLFDFMNIDQDPNPSQELRIPKDMILTKID